MLVKSFAASIAIETLYFANPNVHTHTYKSYNTININQTSLTIAFDEHLITHFFESPDPSDELPAAFKCNY